MVSRGECPGEYIWQHAQYDAADAAANANRHRDDLGVARSIFAWFGRDADPVQRAVDPVTFAGHFTPGRAHLACEERLEEVEVGLGAEDGGAVWENPLPFVAEAVFIKHSEFRSPSQCDVQFQELRWVYSP